MSYYGINMNSLTFIWLNYLFLKKFLFQFYKIKILIFNNNCYLLSIRARLFKFYLRMPNYLYTSELIDDDKLIISNVYIIAITHTIAIIIFRENDSKYLRCISFLYKFTNAYILYTE